MTAGAPELRGSVTIAVSGEEDLMAARHAVRSASMARGFPLSDQTRIVTAATELARNAYIHDGGGTVTIQEVHRPGGKGLRISVAGQGQGTSAADALMSDEPGPGHELGGVRRLVDDFEFTAVPGEGSTATVIHWIQA
ncbi:ATP-binding protein [Nonomuraea dietziae]|uniref:ATP-binding protein n=1 Tax=Nonomuraea dietziae TaxID=65515 RepID=UPI003435FFB8